MIHYIDELEKKDLKGKKVLLRLDLNVPIHEGEVTDPHRIEKIIDTVDFLRGMEAQIIIISHLVNKSEENLKLLPVWKYLNGYFPVEFSETYFTVDAAQKLSNMKDKGVLLFENIRENPGEKENDKEFAEKLSKMGDIYVNDAFSVSHRNHASIVSLPEFLPHFGGLLMRQEIEHLSHILHPKHPFVFILGGAKFNTKLPLIKKYLGLADNVFVCGALANDIFREKGFEVGTSLISKTDFGIKDILENSKLLIPVDVTVSKNNSVSFKKSEEVEKDEYIADAGPETLSQLRDLLKTAKTILWNGPLGNYEAGFRDKTKELAEILAKATENGIETIVGGADTLASINTLGIENKFSFVSTGGGAMLDFLANETLPGILALDH